MQSAYVLVNRSWSDRRCFCLLRAQQQPPASSFKSGVELINVTATVSDDTGRFMQAFDRMISRWRRPAANGLALRAERVPVSLVSRSTQATAWPGRESGARTALDRFSTICSMQRMSCFV